MAEPGLEPGQLGPRAHTFPPGPGPGAQGQEKPNQEKLVPPHSRASLESKKLPCLDIHSLSFLSSKAQTPGDAFPRKASPGT